MEKKKYPLRLCKGFISLMGWITHSDTYEWYLMYIKPLISVRAVKRIISKTGQGGKLKIARMENQRIAPHCLKRWKLVNANTYIQRRNINRIERDSMDGSEEKEVGYTCEYRFLSEEEYYNLIQQEENTEK